MPGYLIDPPLQLIGDRQGHLSLSFTACQLALLTAPGCARFFLTALSSSEANWSAE